MFKVGDSVVNNAGTSLLFTGVGKLQKLCKRGASEKYDEWRVKWSDSESTMYAWSLELVPSEKAEGKFHTLAAEVADLVTTKQAAYGDSFSKSGVVMAQLYPNGISPDQMQDALIVVRILDKLFRIATDRDALGEDPFKDIAGYAVLSMARRTNK